MIGEIDKDKNINLVSEQAEVHETVKPLKDDDDATLAETLLNIKRSTTKDKGKEEEVKAQADIDQEVEEMKLYVKIVPDEDIAIDPIPLATKPPMIMEYKRAEHLKGLHMSRNYVPTYTLSGFVWSFKIWILESFQRINCWWTKDGEVIPRGLALSRKAIFKSYDVSYLFSKESKPTVDLQPTIGEYLTEWWTFNNEFLKNYIPSTLARTPYLFYSYLNKVVSESQQKKYSRILTTSIPTVPRSKISMLKDQVITDLNSHIFKLQAIIQDALNKEFVELFKSPSTSSGSACLDLDIEEDADEFRMKLEAKEILLFKEEQKLEEDSRLRLEQEAKMIHED
nr:phospholipase-like protein [Tanacetum cinerariifolium]